MRRHRMVLTALGSVFALLTPGWITPAAGESQQQTDGQQYEELTGSVDDFYQVPDPLPPGEPGDLIRVQNVSESADEVTVRVMYHSRDAGERDRAVTSIITYPTAPAPDGGWPVVSWAHGGISMASQCAPSRGGQAAPAFGLEGVRVATDYVGMGPVGEIRPVLSRPSAGNSVIDAVRAARQLQEANAGSTWLAVGHSAGGHGALAAHELAASHAPELDLIGTVAFAPASGLGLTFGPVDEIVTSVVGAVMVYGAPSEHPEIVPDDYAGDALAALGDLMQTRCQPEFETQVAAVKAAEGDNFWRQDPLVTEPARSLLLANDVGQVSADAPLVLLSGTADPVVVIDRVRALYAQLCDVGQVTDMREVSDADHNTVIPMTSSEVEAWLADRLDGLPAANSCTDAPPPEPEQPGSPGEPADPPDPADPEAVPLTPPAQPVPAQPTFTG